MEDFGKMRNSDLAKECVDRLKKTIPGIEQRQEKIGALTVHRMKVLTPEAAEQIGKPVGNYITLCCGAIDRLDFDLRREIKIFTAGELRRTAQRLCRKKSGETLCILVAGLGNADLTADALGGLTTRKICVTGHLSDRDPFFFDALRCCRVYALAPGAQGQTGMDAAALLASAVQTVSADLLIAVDSLAASGIDHLFGVIQLSDTGIIPGSGVGNHRTAITPETVRVPVISVGVPTVVSSSALVRDVLELAGIDSPDGKLQEILENKVRLFVTPGNGDETVRLAASLLADALNLAFAGEAATLGGLS